MGDRGEVQSGPETAAQDGQSVTGDGRVVQARVVALAMGDWEGYDGTEGAADATSAGDWQGYGEATDSSGTANYYTEQGEWQVNADGTAELVAAASEQAQEEYSWPEGVGDSTYEVPPEAEPQPEVATEPAAQEEGYEQANEHQGYEQYEQGYAETANADGDYDYAARADYVPEYHSAQAIREACPPALFAQPATHTYCTHTCLCTCPVRTRSSYCRLSRQGTSRSNSNCVNRSGFSCKNGCRSCIARMSRWPLGSYVRTLRGLRCCA